MKFHSPFHPVIFALHPVLALYSGNTAEATLSETVIPGIFALCLTLLVFSLGQLFCKNPLKSAIIASSFTVFCFSFFRVYLSVIQWPLNPVNADTHLGLEGFLALWLLLLGGLIYVIAKTHFDLFWFNQLFNAAAIGVVTISIVNIVGYELRNPVDWAGLESHVLTKPLPVPTNFPQQKPDVYYIIMDRYASASTLKNVYGFDNKEFLTYLKNKGFYVAAQSAANYPTTGQSVASSLNFQYLDAVKDYIHPESDNWILFHKLLEEHRVGQFFKSLGYQFIHLGSWWEPTRKNRFADKNIIFKPLPDMFYVVYGTTLLYPLGSRLGIFDIRQDIWQRSQREFRDLAGAAEIKGPKFVFAHFLLPHEPYVFDRDGGFVTVETLQKQSREQNYVEQLIFTNRSLKIMLDKILSHPGPPPIILLQADEGPWPERYGRDQMNFNWLRATDRELEEKMRILNAYYLPGAKPDFLYSSISPVNSFRVIFNAYFATGLNLLPDESYVFRDKRHPYQWSRITERLGRPGY